MTNKVSKLIEKCKSIIPLEGRILVHPLKLRTCKEMQVYNTDIPMVAGLNEEETDVTPIVETEQKEIEVNKRFQEAIVLRLPEGETRFNVGDTIIYGVGSVYEFDFINGVSILHKYDPVAQVV